MDLEGAIKAHWEPKCLVAFMTQAVIAKLSPASLAILFPLGVHSIWWTGISSNLANRTQLHWHHATRISQVGPTAFHVECWLQYF